MMRSLQKGTSTVEFAIVGALFFTVLFGVAEVARALYVWNTLAEATRRGARIAAVCPVNHSAIRRIAVFDNATGGGSSPIVGGLNSGNIRLEYLDSNGVVIADPVSDFIQIRYVRVAIAGYQHQFLVPFFSRLMNVPSLETTLPRESLGIPRVGAGQQCFGTSA